MGTDSGPFPFGTCSAPSISPLSVPFQLLAANNGQPSASPDDARPSDSRFLSLFQGLTSTREVQPNGLHPFQPAHDLPPRCCGGRAANGVSKNFCVSA